MPTPIPLPRARAFWHARAGLASPVPMGAGGTLADLLARTGWPRTLGGVDVYLAVRARRPGMNREELDRAVVAMDVQVIPAVRGCIYVVPRPQVPLVLRIAEDQARKRLDRDMEKVGVPAAEIDAIGDAVVATLGAGALGTDALRKALPAGTVRSLGELGKKTGVSSTLPPALRYLEFAGRLERTLPGGRLDSERYAWRVPARNPFDDANVPDDVVERNAALAHLFFGHAGPVTMKDFGGWAGLSDRDAKAAMARVPLVPVSIEGYATEAWVLEEDLPRLREPAAPSDTVSLVAFEDNLLALRGGPALFADPVHHGVRVPTWSSGHRTAPLAEARHMATRALFVGDTMVGLWELDPDAGSVVLGTFSPLPAALRERVEAAAADTAAFLRDDLQNARSFSLDTVEQVRERAATIRALGASA
ncbi:MAG: crosslink repair DNA glycosylase YcaQ family protein [Pseudomonadota bacterium]|nr:crosslink repair DNA glycosylase YcaQ family protein [Pseudomonadota bacterium]